MIKVLVILFSLFLLNSCNFDNIVGKQILCVRVESIGFDDMRSYEFISENKLVRTYKNFDLPFKDDGMVEEMSYKLTSDTIEVYYDENKISEVISRKDLTIDFSIDKNWNFDPRECKVFKGDIKEKMKTIHINKNRDHKNNFFDKLLYKI